MANELGNMGEHKKAYDAFKDIYEIRSRPDKLGPEHPDTLTTRANMANELGNMGEHKKAYDAFKDIYEIRSRPDKLGPEHPSTLTTRANMGRYLALVDDAASASADINSILLKWTDKFGPLNGYALRLKFYLLEINSKNGPDFDVCLIGVSLRADMLEKLKPQHYYIRELDALLQKAGCDLPPSE